MFPPSAQNKCIRHFAISRYLPNWSFTQTSTIVLRFRATKLTYWSRHLDWFETYLGADASQSLGQ